MSNATTTGKTVRAWNLQSGDTVRIGERLEEVDGWDKTSLVLARCVPLAERVLRLVCVSGAVLPFGEAATVEIV